MALRSECMADDKHGAQPTQPTQPKKGYPVEIPVPKREDFDKLVRRATTDDAGNRRVDKNP